MCKGVPTTNAKVVALVHVVDSRCYLVGYLQSHPNPFEQAMPSNSPLEYRRYPRSVSHAVGGMAALELLAAR